LINLAKNKNKK
jgi:hypothetical protein